MVYPPGQVDQRSREKRERALSVQSSFKLQMTCGRGKTWVVPEHQKSMSGDEFGWSWVGEDVINIHVCI
jgi:hypothetical protein